jgi:hypothetical protein
VSDNLKKVGEVVRVFRQRETLALKHVYMVCSKGIEVKVARMESG